MTTRFYKFNWDFIGNIEEGRPNLGNTTRIEVYRLFQYTLRDIMEEKLGTEEADHMLHAAGFLAGKHFFEKFIGTCDSVDTFVSRVQQALMEFNIGILRVEQVNMDTLTFVLSVSEDLDCSGLPELSHGVCTYDEGFVAGLFFGFTGKEFVAEEVDCWCTGDRTCRFEVRPR